MSSTSDSSNTPDNHIISSPEELQQEFGDLLNVDAVLSLDRFVTRQTSTLNIQDSLDSEKLFDLKEEVLLSKYTQGFFLPVVKRLTRRITHLLNEEEKLALKGEPLGSAERGLLESDQRDLIGLGDKLQDTLNKTARLVKQAVEVEAIKSSKLDSIQLLSILNQIPELISTVIRAALLLVIDEIQREVESHFVSDAHIRELHNRVRFFGRLRDLAIDEVLQNVLSEINSVLSSVQVQAGGPKGADIPKEGISLEELGRKELLDEVNSMLDSVPVSAENDSS